MRKLIPPRGIFVPSIMLFDQDRPECDRLPPVVRDTAIQIMALAWGKRETAPVSFDELSALTGKSVPTLYAHMGMLRDLGRLAWRPSDISTIIVTLLDGMYYPNDSENSELHDHLKSKIKNTPRIKSKNSVSENSESAPRARDAMFDAIVSVTQVDPTIKSAAASVGKAKRELTQAQPPYTPDDILAFGVWWNCDDWRRKNGPPACHQLTQKIGIIRNGNGAGSHANSGSSFKVAGGETEAERERIRGVQAEIERKSAARAERAKPV